MTAVLTILKGHWKLIGLALLLGALAIQSARLANTKGDLRDARAALVNPLTMKTWQSEALRDARDLATCKANTDSLRAAVDRQNAAVTAAAAEGQARTAAAQKAVQQARTATQRAEAKAQAILSRQPVGIDTCARVLDVDRQFTEQLR